MRGGQGSGIMPSCINFVMGYVLSDGPIITLSIKIKLADSIDANMDNWLGQMALVLERSEDTDT